MSITPDDQRLAETIVNAFSQFDKGNARENLYAAIETFLSGDQSQIKFKFKFQNEHGLDNIRFINEQFRADLASLASALKEIDTAQKDLRHKKCDAALTLMSQQVEKGDVIYQVKQKQEKVLAAASPQAAQTYQEQRAQKAKEPKPVHTLSAQAQKDIAKKITGTFSIVHTPIAKKAELKQREQATPLQRKADNHPTATPTERQTTKSEKETARPMATSRDERQRKTTWNDAGKENQAAERREQIAKEDQIRRDKTKHADERVTRAQGKDPTSHKSK